MQRRPQTPELLSQLVRQLPSGSDHQRENPERVLGEPLQYRQRKRRRFATAGLGKAQDVPSRQDFGDTVGLDRRGLPHTELGTCSQDPVGEPEVGECGGGVSVRVRGFFDFGLSAGGVWRRSRVRVRGLGGFWGLGSEWFEEREV